MLGTKAEATLNIREAHNLWDVLNSKYQMMEKLLILEGFIHDPDLKIAFKLMGGPIQKNINILEKELATYSVPATDQNRAAAQIQATRIQFPMSTSPWMSSCTSRSM